MSAAVARYREQFERLRPELPGAGLGWLDRARCEAFERFERDGFPKPRDEDWKYTRVSTIENRVFESVTGTSGEAGLSSYLPTLEGYLLVFVNGSFRAGLSNNGSPPRGLRLLDLATGLRDSPATVEPHLNRYAETQRHAFTALNTAFAADGVLIELDAGTEVDRPVHLLFASTGQADTIAHPRVVIACGRDSRATVVESFVGLGESAYFNNALTEACLNDGASLEHYKIQREAETAFHVSTLQVQQRARSRFVSHSVSLGAALSRHDINVALDGEGAQCMLNGLYAAHARQHVDYHTRIDHAKPQCTSVEDYRGILAGRARGVFNGRVMVHPNAQKTDASQSNKNLLLSREAEVDTKPQLEIYADDVKCAHGATVGQLDEQMVFYLRARGLSEELARGLLTYGFARDIVDRIAVPAIRESVAEALLDRMPHREELRSILS